MSGQSDISRLGNFTLLLVACLTIMVGCVIVPGLPDIARRLGVPHAASWLVTLPSLGVVIFGTLAGKLIQRKGLYRALCIGLFLYGLLGAAGAFLHGVVMVFTDRLLLGGATAIVMAAGTGLISSFHDGDARLKMIAKQGMSIELGGVVFLSLGGVLAGLAWFWPFALYLFAWLMLVLVWLYVPVPPTRKDPDDDEETRRPPSNAIRRIYAAACGSMIVFFTAVIVLPYQLHALGLGESETGYFLSFVSLVAVGAAAIMPRVIRRLGEYNTLLMAFTAYGVAHGLFSIAANLPLMVAGAILMGSGFGLSVPLVNHMTVEQSHAAVRGRNLAYLSMALFTGQFLSAFTEFIPGSRSLVFLVAATVAGVMGVVLWVSHRSHRRQTSAVTSPFR
ncbi:MFS transporter [Salinicola aestuarinus]|uniref:MFS transporter n=1 Tax=Salinicola aestuarinus TaxID=1949082 RepID=UPI000DA1BDE9|nr:MFS transporter [Salinicola aestuarinus]